MHGWERMCGPALAGPSFPRIITRHVSSKTPVTAALRELNAPKRIMVGLRALGVVQLEDLMDLQPDDLVGVGMAQPRHRSRFMQVLWDNGPIRNSIDPSLQNSTTLGDLVDHLRIQAFRRNLANLGVRTVVDLSLLTDHQLVSLNMSFLQRRRIAVAIQQARTWNATIRKTSAWELLKQIRPPLHRESEMCEQSNQPARQPVVHDPEACDCSWTRGPMCRGQWDDFTKCWAVCCPTRGPRFGDWNITRASARLRQRQRRRRFTVTP